MARVVAGDGYWMVTPPDGYEGKTYMRGRYVYEHRLVLEQHLGRLLTYDDVVHHKDGNKLNNSVDNLELLSRESHGARHRSGQKHLLLKCLACGKEFVRRARTAKRNTTYVGCSLSCARKLQAIVLRGEQTWTQEDYMLGQIKL